MGQIDLYTDGSCNPDKKVGAWAVLIHSSSENLCLEGIAYETTHQQMELLAVIKALSHLYVQKECNASINLFTDSQYIVDLPQRQEKLEASNFLSKKGNPVRNKALVQELFELLGKFSVTFFKIKAHQKAATEHQAFNREVDMRARKILREEINKKAFHT